MKKFTKVIAIVLVLATLVCAFASCGKKIKGKYEATVFGTGTCLEFKGSKVMAQFKVLGTYGEAVEGKYEIKDGKITLTFEGEDKNANALEGTFDFEEGEDYIKIGLVKYTKAE
jgi:hypothetical protein